MAKSFAAAANSMSRRKPAKKGGKEPDADDKKGAKASVRDNDKDDR